MEILFVPLLSTGILNYGTFLGAQGNTVTVSGFVVAFFKTSTSPIKLAGLPVDFLFLCFCVFVKSPYINVIFQRQKQVKPSTVTNIQNSKIKTCCIKVLGFNKSNQLANDSVG